MIESPLYCARCGNINIIDNNADYARYDYVVLGECMFCQIYADKKMAAKATTTNNSLW